MYPSLAGLGVELATNSVIWAACFAFLGGKLGEARLKGDAVTR